MNLIHLGLRVKEKIVKWTTEDYNKHCVHYCVHFKLGYVSQKSLRKNIKAIYEEDNIISTTFRHKKCFEK